MELTVYLQHMWQLAMQGQTQGVWFWAAIYTFIICSYSLLFQVRTRYWPVTTGELVALGVDTFAFADSVKAEQDYIAKALYTYQVAGEVYTGKKISPWTFVASHNVKALLELQMSAVQRLPDGKVKVYYNANNPKKSYLIIAGKLGITITWALSVLPLLAYYLKFHF